MCLGIPGRILDTRDDRGLFMGTVDFGGVRREVCLAYVADQVATGDYVALMPRQIAVQPLAAQFISIIEVEEQGYELEVGAILRSDAMVSPVLRHLITHLHRAAHQAGVHNGLAAIG